MNTVITTIIITMINKIQIIIVIAIIRIRMNTITTVMAITMRLTIILSSLIIGVVLPFIMLECNRAFKRFLGSLFVKNGFGGLCGGIPTEVLGVPVSGGFLRFDEAARDLHGPCKRCSSFVSKVARLQ